MKVSGSLFAALSATFLLLLIAGSAFSGFQNWVTYQSHTKKASVPKLTVNSGIRLVSSDVPVPEPRLSYESVPVKKTSVVVENVPLTYFPSVNNQPAGFPSRPVEKVLQETIEPSVEPTVVVYDDELVVEFPKAIADLRTIKRVIARLLLSDRPFEEDLLSTATLSFKNRPYFYRKVLDQYQKPIRYPANAFGYVDHLVDPQLLDSISDEEGEFLMVHIPLVKPNYPKPVDDYKDWVMDYSKRFKVSPALVFAIMETESGFKPDAVSRSNALGLMQLKADTAGRDVYQYIDFKQGKPTRQDLFDEKNNIRMGTAYLGLLAHDYLASVRNKENRELLVIASYNGGLSTVLKLFGATEEQAIEHINRLHPRQVYRKLRFEHQSDETRRYLDKVVQAKLRYRAYFESV